MTSLECLDLSRLPRAEREAALESAAAGLQAGLNLDAGPLLRAALIDVGDPTTTYLLVVIHHLVVDAVSWRIFTEDLWNAYDQLVLGRDIQLPPKTTSFQLWSKRLTDYARSGALGQEVAYWRTLSHSTVCHLPTDFPGGANTAASASAVTVMLNAEETRALLQDIPKVYHTQINDVLLTALVRAIASWTGGNSVLVDLEGHGREPVIGEHGGLAHDRLVHDDHPRSSGARSCQHSRRHSKVRQRAAPWGPRPGHRLWLIALSERGCGVESDYRSRSCRK